MSNDGAVHPTLGQCHVPTLIGKFNYVEKGEAETRVSPTGTAQALGGRPPAASHTVPRQSSRPLPRGSPKRSENACPRRLVHSPNVCPHKTGKGGMDRHPPHNDGIPLGNTKTQGAGTRPGGRGSRKRDACEGGQTLATAGHAMPPGRGRRRPESAVVGPGASGWQAGLRVSRR